MLTRLRDLNGAGATARNRRDERNRAVCSALLSCRIHTALESLTGVRKQTETARAPPDRFRSEIGDLQEDIGGLGADGCAPPAHDSRKTDGAFAVGNEEHVGGRLDLLTVQENET